MRMKTRANASLAVLATLFVAAAICCYAYPGQWWPRMMLYTAEAGLVGALADLFAVTVLFRHPFGWKWVPHTAIIPKNRDKLVDGVAQMVERQLLGKEALVDKLKQAQIVESIIGWIDQKPLGKGIAEHAWQLIVRLLEKLDVEDVSIRLDRHARQQLRGVNAAPYASRALKWLVQRKALDDWLDGIVDAAAKFAASDEAKQIIRDMLAREKQKYVSEGGIFARWFKGMVMELAESADAVNFDAAAEAIHTDLQSFIHNLRNPEHELRLLIIERLGVLAGELETSADLTETVNLWKEELLEQISFLPSIQATIETVKSMLVSKHSELPYVTDAEQPVNSEDVRQWAIEQLDSLWQWFKGNEQAKERLEQYIQQFIRQLIETEHALIGNIVRKTLDGFTEQRLVHFIESKVETDLQRIRLNGAFIGSMLGLAIYAILHGIYAPFLQWLQGQ